MEKLTLIIMVLLLICLTFFTAMIVTAVFWVVSEMLEDIKDNVKNFIDDMRGR